MKKTFATTGKILLGLTISIIFIIMGTTILSMTGAMQEWNQQLITTGGMLFGGFITYVIFERKDKWPLGFRQTRIGVNFIAGSAAGILFISLVFLGIWILGGIHIDRFQLDARAWNLFGIQIVVFLFVAVGEEFICRGYFQGLIKHNFGLRSALVVPSIIFSMLHLGNPAILINPLPLLNILLVGVLFALARELTQGLWFPIGFHFTWNLFQGSVFGFAVSGTDSGGFMTVAPQGSVILSGGSFGAEGSLVTTIIMIISCVIGFSLVKKNKFG
ncbi:CAAX amino terminal protease self- immunity [compost metagenome]